MTEKELENMEKELIAFERLSLKDKWITLAKDLGMKEEEYIKK